MTFPVVIHIGTIEIPAHLLFEGLAYFVGFRVYLQLRKRRGDRLSQSDRWTIVAAAALGAALGSKFLFWLSDPRATIAHWNDPIYLMSGKTIVGGLIGGLLAVEWIKRRVGIGRPTGDLFAIPLIVGIAIGRVGCFLSGLEDHTHGHPTSLPWGIDLGDGVRRHPVQLYEIAWLGLLAAGVVWLSRRAHREGDLFKAFMVGYMLFRLFGDHLKPGVELLGFTAIQWAAFLVFVYYRKDVPYFRGTERFEART